MAYVSNEYLCKNLYHLRTTKSYSGYTIGSYLRLVFYTDPLYSQTGSDLITPAAFCLIPASFKLSVLHRLDKGLGN
jgi:hypothetical protein